MKKYFKMLILTAAIGLAAVKVQAQVRISVRIGPPALPVYVQPPCPVDGYLWQPGYWAYDDADGYYWVPGEWVEPPSPGLLWTPCYWGWDNGVYLYHAGYWGPHVGFYGGINYGFGYPGSGFYGGVWSGRSFRYNTAVFNVNRTVIHNTYINRSFPSGGGSRVSYNGGHGGINRQPSATERRFASENHVAATHAQMEHQQNAGRNPAQRFNTNHGRPATLAGHAEPRGGAQAHAPNAAAHGAAPHAAPNMGGHEAHTPNAGRPQMENHAPAAHQPGNMSHANHEMNAAPRAPQQHISQPEQHANRMPSQPQQHMGGNPGGQPHMGGNPGGGHPMGGPPAGGGMPHGGGGPPGGGMHMGGGGGMPHGGGGPPGGGGGHPMGGGGGGHGGGHHP